MKWAMESQCNKTRHKEVKNCSNFNHQSTTSCLVFTSRASSPVLAPMFKTLAHRVQSHCIPRHLINRVIHNCLPSFQQHPDSKLLGLCLSLNSLISKPSKSWVEIITFLWLCSKTYYTISKRPALHVSFSSILPTTTWTPSLLHHGTKQLQSLTPWVCLNDNSWRTFIWICGSQRILFNKTMLALLGIHIRKNEVGPKFHNYT